MFFVTVFCVVEFYEVVDLEEDIVDRGSLHCDVTVMIRYGVVWFVREIVDRGGWYFDVRFGIAWFVFI